LVSPGYGFTIGGLTTYNLLPTSLTISLYSQYNWVSGVTSQNVQTYWTTIGLQFGMNLDDKVTEIIDLDLPNIFEIF